MTVVPVTNWKTVPSLCGLATTWFAFDPDLCWRNRGGGKHVHVLGSRLVVAGLCYGSWSDSVTQLWPHSTMIWKQAHKTQSDFGFWNNPCNWTLVLPAIAHIQSYQPGDPLGGLQRCPWRIANQPPYDSRSWNGQWLSSSHFQLWSLSNLAPLETPQLCPCRYTHKPWLIADPETVL